LTGSFAISITTLHKIFHSVQLLQDHIL